MDCGKKIETVYVAKSKDIFSRTNPSFHVGRSFVLNTVLLTQHSSHKDGKKMKEVLFKYFFLSRGVCAHMTGVV